MLFWLFLGSQKKKGLQGGTEAPQHAEKIGNCANAYQPLLHQPHRELAIERQQPRTGRFSYAFSQEKGIPFCFHLCSSTKQNKF